MNKWQPIETAPRGDDNEFLAWDGEFMHTTWEGWTNSQNGTPVYVHSDWISWEPTHWMPLPEPPEN